MPSVTVRHFTTDDIPIRSELLRESFFQANLTDFAMSTGEDALVENQRRTITEEHRVKRILTMCGPTGQVWGFAWITSIDWRAQCCELSFGVLPRYRGGFGAAAVGAAHAYIRAELNMRVVIHQVLEHNRMLNSAERMADQHQVRCDFDSYTVGQWRTALYWSATAEEVADQERRDRERRAARADRIRERSPLRS